MLDKFLVGNYTNAQTCTGVTVVLAMQGAVGGCSVRGGAPASHETELLRAENTVDKINACCLCGGSAFGLESTSGVMQFLHEKGAGFNAGKYNVPICVGASIYDLECGEFDFPDKRAGYLACLNAAPVADVCGRIGGGAGATVCKMSGMQHASPSGMAVVTGKFGAVEMAVITVVNALGNIYNPTSGAVLKECPMSGTPACGNTTITCVITNADLTKAQANKLADVTHDAYAKCIRPVHTVMDGDTVFVMASGEVRCDMIALQLAADDLCQKAIIKAAMCK